MRDNCWTSQQILIRACASTPCEWPPNRLEWHVPPKQLLSTSTLIKLADDPAIRVRLQAALALGNRCRNEPAALQALGRIAAKDADDPWMRLAILSGLAESSLAFIPCCDGIPSATGREEMQSQAAAIVGVRRRMPELTALLEMIGVEVEKDRCAMRRTIERSSIAWRS